MVTKARRRLLMRISGKLDTSPKILQYDKRFYIDGSIIDQTGSCITEIYDCAVNIGDDRSFRCYGLVPSTINYKDGAFFDYWNQTVIEEPLDRLLARVETDQMQFTLSMSLVDNCFVYQITTGIILFAGKNTPYYGYKNINDMPTTQEGE